MISLERMLRHMAWSNQYVLHFLQELPDEALAAYVVNPEWHVERIITHTVGAASWYCYRLTGEEFEDLPIPTTTAELAVWAELAKRVDEVLLREAEETDRLMKHVNEEGEVLRWRSTILSQAVHHATEHRAQLACALEARGFPAPDLDEIDLWAFEILNG